jgi:hypothetical protein
LAPSEWPWSAAARGEDSIEFQFLIQVRFQNCFVQKHCSSQRINDSI